MIRGLLWFFFAIEVLGAITRLVMLAVADYPRNVRWSRREDAAVVFIATCTAVLLFWVLTRAAS